MLSCKQRRHGKIRAAFSLLCVQLLVSAQACSAINLFENGLYGIVLIGCDELLHPRLAFVSLFDGNEVAIWVIGNGFLRNAVIGAKTSLQSPIRVDDSRIQIINGTTDNARVELLDFQLLRVFSNICQSCQNAGAVFQLDQAFILKKAKCTALIGRIVRHAHLCPFFQISHSFVRLGVKPDWPYTGVANWYDLVAMLLDLIVEVWLVLEGVGVDLAALQRFVWRV